MVYVGIDVGKKGGYSLLYSNGHVECFPFDKQSFINTMQYLSQQIFETKVIIERVHAMPQQGVVSTFNFGVSYGFIKGVLQSFNLYYIEVTPQEWKKEFKLLKTTKQDSIKKAKELYPKVNLFATNKSKKESDGMAESLLIAEYGRRKSHDKN